MNRHDPHCCVLAGDIGGTKTHVALFGMRARRPVLRVMETYRSRDASSLDALIDAFLATHPVSVQSACFGIAGPVVDGRCTATNLPWVVSERRLATRFGWDRVRLINDVCAAALWIPFLTAKDRVSLFGGRRRKGGTIGLMAPGTGLGISLLATRDGVYLPLPSEGGHVDFAPRTDRELGLWRYLTKRFGRVSVERAASGPGLVAIYSWLASSGRFTEPEWLKTRIRESDPANVIAGAALGGESPLCEEALDVFVSLLGAAAGNLALTGMTTGGMYLGGGIPPKILPALKTDSFREAFVDKGRFRPLMERIPVVVILDHKAALMGAGGNALNGEGRKK